MSGNGRGPLGGRDGLPGRTCRAHVPPYCHRHARRPCGRESVVPLCGRGPGVGKPGRALGGQAGRALPRLTE